MKDKQGRLNIRLIGVCKGVKKSKRTKFLNYKARKLSKIKKGRTESRY